jgi:hypothetical protein
MPSGPRRSLVRDLISRPGDLREERSFEDGFETLVESYALQMAKLDCLDMESARDLARAFLAWLKDPDLDDRMGWLRRARQEVDEGRDPSRPGVPDDPGLDEAAAMELFGPAAVETIQAAWAKVVTDPLPVEVEERAVETLIAGGVSGVPGRFACYYSDPREALASALPEGDPRAEALRADIEAQENVWEYGKRLLPWDGENPPLREMERILRRRQPRLRPARRREHRTPSTRRRSSTGTSLTGTDPPADDPDDLDDTGPQPGDAGPFGVPEGER